MLAITFLIATASGLSYQLDIETRPGQDPGDDFVLYVFAVNQSEISKVELLNDTIKEALTGDEAPNPETTMITTELIECQEDLEYASSYIDSLVDDAEKTEGSQSNGWWLVLLGGIGVFYWLIHKPSYMSRIVGGDPHKVKEPSQETKKKSRSWGLNEKNG